MQHNEELCHLMSHLLQSQPIGSRMLQGVQLTSEYDPFNISFVRQLVSAEER